MILAEDLTACRTLAVLFLILSSVSDLREHEIDLKVLSLTVLTGLAGFFLMGFPSAADLPGRFLPGAFLLLLSLLSKGAVGGGDGLVLLVLGFFLTGREVFYTFFLASLLGGAAGVVLLIKNRKDKKAEFPFVPAFLGGLLAALCLGV